MQSFAVSSVGSTVSTSHLNTNASQIMKTINIAGNKMNKPVVDTVFHVVCVSEQSE